MGTIIPLDYKKLAAGIEQDDQHSAITKSQSSSSSVNREVFAYMAEIPEDIAKRLEEQELAQKM